jgi:hypothetical protein
MRLNWQKHHLFPNDLSHAHHNGYSILWARTSGAKSMIIGATYEIYPSADGVERFRSRDEMIKAIS